MESDKYIIKVIDHIKKEGHMHYIINVEKNGQNFSFTERYSGLRGLNEALRKSTNKLTFPKFQVLYRLDLNWKLPISIYY